MAKKKREEKVEKKEIKILRVVNDNLIKEIKKEKVEKVVEEKVEEFENFNDFISGQDVKMPELSSGQVQNLEQDLAHIPSAPQAKEEDELVKYGAGGGKMGYGDFSYEINREYKSGMDEPMMGNGGGRNEFVMTGDSEVNRVRDATKSVQDRVMGYSNRTEQKDDDRDKKKRMEM